MRNSFGSEALPLSNLLMEICCWMGLHFSKLGGLCWGCFLIQFLEWGHTSAGYRLGKGVLHSV